VKIWCQLPMQFDVDSPETKKFFDLVEVGFRLVKREDTEVKIVPLSKGIPSMEWMTYPGFRFLNEREIVRSSLQGEKEGYDGIIVANYFDSGLWAVRQMTTIPVTGFAEAAMLFACMVGNKFATIVANEKFTVDMENTIERYGLRSRAIDYKPVRHLTLTYDTIQGCCYDNYAPLITDFESIARTCIADGAEVIIAGGGIFSLLLTQGGVREIDGVPYLDPFIICLKTAEMAVDLHKAGIPVKSRERLYLTPPQSTIEQALKFFGDC
jgi:allantoin racemase